MASPKKQWAILIGVDFQDPQSEFYKPENVLLGAANDAILMYEYLNPIDKTQSIDSTLLVTGKPGCKLPTRKNVVEALNHTINSGQPGDAVYIHYSGHGTRQSQKDAPEESPLSSSRPGLALVLYDLYLFGDDLRTYLKKMEEKELFVTLVLDCCFSGSVMRNESALPSASIRFVECDPVLSALSEGPIPFSSASTSLRKAVLDKDPATILDPEKHAILTACGPGQTAGEVCNKKRTQFGAFSYFLHDTLRALQNRQARISGTSLHQHLSACFHANRPTQTPLWFGKHGSSFFEGLDVEGPPFVSMFRTREGHLVLHAGQAHGVYDQDEYMAVPHDTTEECGRVFDDTPAIKVVVRKVESLRSELEMANQSDNMRVAIGSIWKAWCIKSHASHKVCISITSSVLAQFDWETLRTATREHPFLDLCSHQGDGTDPVLYVTIADNCIYQVQDAVGQPILDLPMLDPNSSTFERTATLVRILGHLATFKYFEGIQNKTPDSTLESEFVMECSTNSAPDGCYEVEDGNRWSATFRNLSPSTKFIAIFNLRPSWQVCNLLACSGDGDSIHVLPKKAQDPGEYSIQITMTVPDHLRDRQPIEDIIKIFITSQPTVFPLMILPPLTDSNRGDSDELERLLEALNNGLRGEGGQWACRNFIIRTRMQPGGKLPDGTE